MASTMVYFVRHGQTLENALGITQGQTDTKLNVTGVQQAKEVAEALKNINFNLAFTSDLSRAVDTANSILKYHPNITLTKLDVLRERYLGNLQGKPHRRLGGPEYDDSVENSDAFKQRTLQFWDKILLPSVQEIQHDTISSNVLVVSHGGFISTLARTVTSLLKAAPPPGVKIDRCPNTSMTTIEIRHDGSGVLRSFGDISHMDKPQHVVVGNSDELEPADGVQI